jgi:valyl-tRNA synthetase
VDTQLPKAYEPADVEAKWYSLWERSGYFQADLDSDKPRYSIVLPPPNVTGSLHMGHALNITLHDVLVRWKRMKGFDVLWLPGTDHAGIATQNVVERRLASEGLHRTDLGREKFEAAVWEWKEQAEKNILTQIRRLGCSTDWSRKRFTLDEGLSRAVREVFVRLYEDGLIYRGEYLVNWCPRCATAISDLEVNYEPAQGTLWYLRYPVKGREDSVVVATTRPETMLGDTAVAIHPEDERYRHLHGCSILLPLMNREIPVIVDSFVETGFGTGVVKVTPGHDPNDFEAGLRHNLPIIKVIGEDGRMTGQAGSYAGLDRYEARKQVVKDLEQAGLLVKKESHAYNIGHCQRCDTVIEPLVSRQWFVKVKPLAQPAIRAVEEGRTNFVPDNYARVYFEWLNNIHDWCISRQLWWGHRIPAWYCECGEMIVARETPGSCKTCGGTQLRQESDVLDTWFSSALWPFSTLGWPERTRELETYYPTSVLVTGFDIIFFWVARMMMAGLKFMGDVPFRTVYINGLVRDEHGQKMSKSRGNIIDPLEIIDQYGTDAVRFTLAVMAVPGTDIPFSMSRMAGYRAFCNKIWNAGRFLLLNVGAAAPVIDSRITELWESGTLELEHRWMLGRLQQVIAECNEDLEKYRFHEASNSLYHFFWHEFCDWYIELIKQAITGGAGPEARERASTVALFGFDTALRLLHPFIPFITEELWQRFPHEGDTIMLSSYPNAKAAWIDQDAITGMAQLQELISAVRTARAENKNIDPRKRLSLQLACSAGAGELIRQEQDQLINLAQLKEVRFVEEIDGDGGRLVHGVAGLAKFALLLDEGLDVEAEKQRLARQIARLREDIERLAAKLQNADFLQRAPAAVVETSRTRYEEAVGQLNVLQEKLNELSES